MAELALGIVGAAATVGAATLTGGYGFTGRHESSHREEMLETRRSMDDFLKNRASGDVTPAEETEFLNIRDEAIQKQNGYYQDIESYKEASWLRVFDKLKKRKQVRQAKRLTRQANHSLRSLNESMYSGSDRSSICASSGSPPGSNLADNDLQDWRNAVDEASDGHSRASPTPIEMFAGSTRISGHHPADRRSGEWGFRAQDYPSPPYSMPPASPPNRSPQAPSSTPVDRPPRKRGKLPKDTTDFLMAWLHRHSYHPYPSEEEKKQLCHATGLSMSQVSNWMINARRLMLAPAHRAATGPTTTAPYPPPRSRSPSLNGLLDARRASLPGADSLQLYHPMTLQSLPHSPYPHPHDMGYGRASVPSLRMGPGMGMDYGPASAGPAPGRGMYGTPGQGGAPLSAPASMSASHPNHFSPGPPYLPSPREDGGRTAYFDSPSSAPPNGGGNDSAPGSAYGLPSNALMHQQ